MHKNMSLIEQGVSLAAGALLLLPVFRRHPLARFVPGGRFLAGTVSAALLRRGATGHCAVYEKFGVDTRRGFGRVLTPEHTVLVNLSRDEVEAALAGEGLPLKHLAPAHLHLTTAPDGRRTRIEASPSAGSALAELRQLKAYLETGEVPTVEGQSTGHRSLIGKSIGRMLPSAKENTTRVGEEPLKVKVPRRMADGGLEVQT